MASLAAEAIPVRAIATAVTEATRQRLDRVRRERVNLAESLLGIGLKPPPAAKATPGKLVTQPLEFLGPSEAIIVPEVRHCRVSISSAA